MKKEKQGSIKYFLILSAVFVVFVSACLGVFFFNVQDSVKANVEETINAHVQRQGYLLQKSMEDQFEYLEGAAEYIGQQEELTGENSMELISAFRKNSSFDSISIINEKGLSYYDTGEVKNVYGREYFHQAMEGERSLSDPMTSGTDGESKVILCVPIYRGEEVIGALGGSYNLSALGNMMFNDIYDGEGYCMIVSADGTVIAMEAEKKSTTIEPEDNLFTYYRRTKFQEGSIADLRADFEGGISGLVQLKTGGVSAFLMYLPLDLSDWFLCYVVPASKAYESYDFIGNYEKILLIVLLGGSVALILFLVGTNVHRQKLLMRFAQTDALTGCRNKLSTMENINLWLEDPSCQTSQALQAVLMMDVDKFKGINDVYGHTVGDAVLQAVGKTLRSFFRDNDIVGRIGGDEFLVMMKNVTRPDDVIKKAEKLSRMMNAIQVENLNQMITVSIGIAFSPTNGKTYEELYLNADKALYQVKRNGRNGCAVYQNQGDAEVLPARTVIYQSGKPQEESKKDSAEKTDGISADNPAGSGGGQK